MRTVSRQSLVDSTMQTLQREIAAGRWQVGEQIPNEQALSEQLGVSRGTIRESVRVLVACGMLETRQGSGTYVISSHDRLLSMRRLNHTSLRDRVEMRALLEAQAARLAALRATPATIVWLEELLEQRNISAKNDRENFIARDFAFHEALVAASGNGALIEIYAFFSRSVQDSIAATLDGDLPEPSHEKHRQIVEAIAAGDADRASEAVIEFMAPLLTELERLVAL